MHLGEATSKRTSTTMRIAWLLLSLSFLLHSVCSESEDQSHDFSNPTTVDKKEAITPNAIPVSTNTDGTTTKKTSVAETEENKSDAENVGNTPDGAAPEKTADGAAPEKTADGAAPEVTPDGATVENKPDGATPENTPDGAPAKISPDTIDKMITSPATASVASKATIITPSGSGGRPVNPSVRANENSVPMEISRTEPSVTLTGSPQHTKTSKISKDSTDTTTVHNGAHSKINQGDQTRTTSLMTSTSTTITEPQSKKLQYSLNSRQEKDQDKELVEVCKQLMVNLENGNCTLSWRQLGDKVQFDYVEINGKVKTNLAGQYYEEISKKKVTDNKTLIAILASCGALLIMIVILAVCASHHRKPYHENQQHLTEELHTVENGYHDNPTLEVMEVQPEMQEKRMVVNGEFNDSWIVPMDNLLKEDIPEEEDTHL